MITPVFTHNRVRIGIAVILGVSIFLFITAQYIGRPLSNAVYHIGPPLTRPPHTEPSKKCVVTDQGYLPIEQATEFCRMRRYQPFKERHRRRKIYDLILLNTELDWLEIRLGEMYDNVDYFIIMESKTTFSAQPKPLTIKDNWQRFAAYHNKMIRHTLDDSKLSPSSTTWERETFSRNAMFQQVIPSLTGDAMAYTGDAIIVSDVDEIPRPDALQTLRNCEFPPNLTLMSRMYYYSYQWLSRDSADWPHPQATYYQGGETIKPQDLRMGDHPNKLYNAAWHCSYCFSSLDEIVQKIASFSHSELNRPEFKDRSAILERARYGLDLFNRSESIYDLVDNNPDIPEVLKNNKEKWAFALDRSTIDANFKDWRPSDSP